MAFIVPVKRGGFEVRESRTTESGPRSRTLASFNELTDEVVERARERASNPPTPEALRRSARRVGAPVRQPPPERAARELIAQLAKGRRLDSHLRRILLGLLNDDRRENAEPSPAGEDSYSVAEWMAATPEQRGKALVDLLLLADALPPGARKGKPLRFPRLDSSRP